MKSTLFFEDKKLPNNICRESIDSLTDKWIEVAGLHVFVSIIQKWVGYNLHLKSFAGK